MGFDIWKPLYADKFDCNKYLYHYTNFETCTIVKRVDTFFKEKYLRTVA